MDPDTLTPLVNYILQKWITVAGIDLSVLSPDKHSWTVSFGGGLAGEANQRDHLKMLEKTWELDPTGLTTLMVVRGFFEEFLSNLKFDALDMILNRAKIAATLAPLEELRDLLEGKVVRGLVEDFQSSLIDSATVYGADTTGNFEKILADKLFLAEIRRDALLALDQLEVHQFLRGDPGGKPIGFNPHVYEFWNMNSVLASLRGQMAQGVTLCLIRDPMELHSFFVFAIKNGENLLILTDRAKVPHPDYKSMSRGKAQTRDFETRAGKFWLPYDLLDLQVSADQKELFAKARTSLVPNNAQGVKLAEIKSLRSAQLIWLMMVFDRINAQFYGEGRTAPQLSYTGEMVVEPYVLVGEHGSLVTQGHYTPLSLEALTPESMKDIHKDEQWGRKATGWNHWMVERYEDQVPTETFQVVGQSQLPQIATSLREKGALALDTRSDWDKQMSRHKGDVHGLRALDPCAFGTAEDLDKDRKWAARVNQTRVIQNLADKEFEASAGKVFAWYERKIKQEATLSRILDSAMREELILPFLENQYTSRKEGEHPFRSQGDFKWRDRIQYRNVVNTAQDSNLMWGRYGSEPWGKGVRLSKWSVLDQGWECIDRQIGANVYYKVSINCPEAIAELLGLKITDLPWPLQHTYFGEEPYSGNSILDRIDPEDWKLENPWMKMDLNIYLPFSKSAVHARRKKLGLPRREWPVVPKRD